MTKKDNDILARDLVLAAFIVMKRQYESRDAGRAGKLQMFLNIHAGTHGDVKNIVAILNNPKSTVKLSEDQQRIYRRALDIVESLQESGEGWFDASGVDLNTESKELLRRINIAALAPFEIEAIQEMLKEMRLNQEVVDNILAKATNESVLSPEQAANIPLSGLVEMTPEQSQQMNAAQTETPKAKPGRKKNPIEAATTNAKKKGKACCN